MGYISHNVLIDSDNDGTPDGILTVLTEGNNMTFSGGSGNITITSAGGGGGGTEEVYFSNGAPSDNDGANGDINLDYTNGDIYRKASGSWDLIESIPSLARTRMFTATYDTSGSGFNAGKFTVDGEYYFHYGSIPGSGSIANAETYATSLGFQTGSRFVFQQYDNPDNVAIYRATSDTFYKTGVTGFSSSANATNNFGFDLVKESGTTLINGQTYTIEIIPRLNIINEDNGSISIKEMNIDSVNYTLSGSGSAQTVVIATFAIATYRSAKYHLQMTSDAGTPEYQISEVALLHNGSTSNINEYGVIFTGASVMGSLSTDINGGLARLKLTTDTSDDYDIKLRVEALKV